jgi:hypothetical protein
MNLHGTCEPIVGTAEHTVASQLSASATKVRALARNPGAVRLSAQIEVVRGISEFPNP